MRSTVCVICTATSFGISMAAIRTKVAGSVQAVASIAAGPSCSHALQKSRKKSSVNLFLEPGLRPSMLRRLSSPDRNHPGLGTSCRPVDAVFFFTDLARELAQLLLVQVNTAMLAPVGPFQRLVDLVGAAHQLPRRPDRFHGGSLNCAMRSCGVMRLAMRLRDRSSVTIAFQSRFLGLAFCIIALGNRDRHRSRRSSRQMRCRR